MAIHWLPEVQSVRPALPDPDLDVRVAPPQRFCWSGPAGSVDLDDWGDLQDEPRTILKTIRGSSVAGLCVSQSGDSADCAFSGR